MGCFMILTRKFHSRPQLLLILYFCICFYFVFIYLFIFYYFSWRRILCFWIDQQFGSKIKENNTFLILFAFRVREYNPCKDNTTCRPLYNVNGFLCEGVEGRIKRGMIIVTIGDIVEASNVINYPKCNKGPKCNNFWP